MSPRPQLPRAACVHVCARVGVRCPPLLVGAVASSPLAASVPCRSCPLPAHRVWGHCCGASPVLLSAEPGSAPAPLGLALSESGAVRGNHTEAPFCRGRGETGSSPSPHHVSLVCWGGGDHHSSLLHRHWGRGFSRPSLPAGLCDCQRSQKPRVPFPFLGR